MSPRGWLTSLLQGPAHAEVRGLTVVADMSGGTITPGQLVSNGHPMLMLTLRRNAVEVEMRLSPAEAGDLADDLAEVVEWLKGEAA